MKATIFALPLLLALGACDDATEKGAESSEQVILAWQAANLDGIDLKQSDTSEAIGGGACRHGMVAKLHVDLCEFKDAIAADSAKELGIAEIGSNTGAALVRGRYLLVVADIDKVDAHGKVLNQVAKIFLKPPAPVSL